MDHDIFSNDLPLYAADALEPDEAAALEAHLKHCASCQQALREYLETWGAVNTALIAEDWEGHQAMRGQFAQRLAEPSADGVAHPAILPSAQRRWGKRPWASLGWVALIMVAIGGWATAYRTHQALQANQAAVQFAATARRVVLTPAHAPNSRVDLYLAAGKVVVWVRNLPKVAPGQTYEGWWIVRGRPQPAGTFGTEPTFLERPAQARAFAITIEPGTGTSQPTTPVLASGQV